MNENGAVKLWILAFVAIFVVGTGVLVGIGCALGANSCPFTKHEPVTTTDGHTLYLAMSCAACHGLGGEGGRGPALKSGDAAELTLEQLKGKIANGKPLAGMPAFKRSLNAAQIEAVARYVLGLRSGT